MFLSLLCLACLACQSCLVEVRQHPVLSTIVGSRLSSGHSPAALALHAAPPFFLPRDPVLAAGMLEAVQSAPSTTQDRDDGTSLLHLERSIVRHASSAAPRQSSAATLPLALPLASCHSTPVYFCIFGLVALAEVWCRHRPCRLGSHEAREGRTAQEAVSTGTCG